MANKQVFLDANAILYSLDETVEQYADTVTKIKLLLDENVTLCTSHHVIEEVIHIARRISNISAAKVLREISKIPDLVLVEPDATIEFAKRYVKLIDKFYMGVNDALLLQIILDANINGLFSYDKEFIKYAEQLGIQQIT